MNHAPHIARSRSVRRLLTLGLLALLLSAALRPPSPRSALAALPASAVSAAIEQHVATLGAAYSQLLDGYLRPIEPVALLQPALDSLAVDGRAAGLSAPALPAGREAAFAALAAYYGQVAANMDEAAARDAAFHAIDAMTGALHDDHTSFIDPEGAAQFSAQLAGGDRFGGGFSFIAGDPPFVKEVAPGGPAAQAGLRPGDALLAVDGRSLAGRAIFAEQGTFRGETGAYTLRARTPGEDERDLRITPGPYALPDWSSQVLPDGVGYMRLRNFIDPWQPPAVAGGRQKLDIDQTLEDFEAAGVTLWVLDLRGNPGGSGLLVDALTGRFVADSPVDRQFDQRGHFAQDLTDGRLFRVQRPLAVLVDGGSTSAADEAASVFKETGRALLVGRRTGGALGNAAIWPIGEGAALEVSFADVHSGLQDTVIDRVGVPVDISAPNRTAADYAAGRDPQLEAAIAALRQQDATPKSVPPNELVPLGAAGVEALLPASGRPAAGTAGALPDGKPAADRGGYTLTSYNDYNNWATATAFTSGSGGGRDPIAVREAARTRGWLGGRVEVYGNEPLAPALWAEWDTYVDGAGASAALGANDFPDQWRVIDAPLQLGDGATVALRGLWGDLGTLLVRWRRGAVVITAEYQTAPGSESPDRLQAFARQVDDAYLSRTQSLSFTLLLAPLLRATALLHPRSFVVGR